MTPPLVLPHPLPHPLLLAFFLPLLIPTTAQTGRQIAMKEHPQVPSFKRGSTTQTVPSVSTSSQLGNLFKGIGADTPHVPTATTTQCVADGSLAQFAVRAAQHVLLLPKTTTPTATTVPSSSVRRPPLSATSSAPSRSAAPRWKRTKKQSWIWSDS